MKRYLYCLIIALTCSLSAQAQFPALEITADSVLGFTGQTVDVSIRAGSNWQNITQIRGTITFDTTVATYNSMTFWGLSNAPGANFTYMGGGVLTYTWSSLITIGPTLSQGDIVFTLRFNVVGANGTMTPVTFGNTPQQLYWMNGFGWSGNNYTLQHGQILVGCGAPVVSWSGSGNLLNWTFTDGTQSSGGQSWLWDFGDGNTSTMQNPTHNYSAPGMYTVCLTVTDSCGSDSSCQQIDVCPVTAASWSHSANELAVTFSDQSSNTPTSWLWDFGDGNTSTMQNPMHTYAVPGTYTVCLTATNACGTDSSCTPVTVTCAAPVANFNSSGTALTIMFTDASTNNPTSWAWDFGDGNTSTMQNPTHTYAAPGMYTVCLVASSICGADSFCITGNITCPAPSAGFTSSATQGTVQFTDTSSGGATSWFWDFGDGNTDTTQHPMHTYAQSGMYTVCLTATSLCGSDTNCTSVNVVIIGTEPTTTMTPGVHPNPAQGVLRITVPNGELQAVRLFDVRGKLVLQADNIGQAEATLRVEALDRGIYFVEMVTDLGVFRQKVLLR